MSDAEINPYASPLASLVPEVVAGEEIWRDGNLLVLHKGSSLPDRCVKCNVPAEGVRLRRKFTWHRPQLYLILVFTFVGGLGLIAYLIAWLVAHQNAEVQFGICRRHLRHRHAAIAVGWLVPLASIAVIAGAASGVALAKDISISAIGVCWALVCVGPIAGVFLTQTLLPKRIDAHFAWLKGACPEFLAELPEVPPAIRRARLGLLP